MSTNHGVHRVFIPWLVATTLAPLTPAQLHAEYDAKHGRFLQRDPIGYVDGMNLYEAFKNNPQRYVDPNGLRVETQDIPLSNGRVIRHFYDVFTFSDQIYLGYVIYDSNDETEKAEVERVTTNREALATLASGAEVANGAGEIALRLNPVSNVVEVVTGKDIVTGESLDTLGYVLAVAGMAGPLDEFADAAKIGHVGDVASGMGKVGGAASDVGKVGHSVWDLGNFLRGWAIEDRLGRNLPKNFPTIDKFDEAKGIATSIKSLDIRAKTYCDLDRLESKVKTYIDKVADFKKGQLGQTIVAERHVRTRGLELAIPPNAARLDQRRVLESLKGYAQQRGVKLSIHEIQ